MRQSSVEFTVDGEPVEGILASPSDSEGPFPASIVCHPHPLLGGHMDSSVVVAVCRALAESGVASLRFDFRRPPGADTDPEALRASAARDAGAAFSLVRRWRDSRRNRCAVAGYSFGAGAIARAYDALRAARAFALIAPPVSALIDSPLITDGRPKLIVVGENDQVVSPAELESLARNMTPPASFERIAGADHFFSGHKDHLGRRVALFLASALL